MNGAVKKKTNIETIIGAWTVKMRPELIMTLINKDNDQVIYVSDKGEVFYEINLNKFTVQYHADDYSVIQDAVNTCSDIVYIEDDLLGDLIKDDKITSAHLVIYYLYKNKL